MISLAVLQDFTGSADDDTLILVEAGVVAMMEAHTGRLFTTSAGSRADVLDGPRRWRGGLTARPVRDLPSVTLFEPPNGANLTEVAFRPGPESDFDDDIRDVADFELRDRTLYIRSGFFPDGRRSVRVTYPFGFAEDQGPPDANLVALEIVKHKMDLKAAGLIKSAGIGPMRITYRDAVGAGVAEGLDALRRPLLPM